VHEVEHHLQDVAAVLRPHGLWYSS
jgi:hypothetical protein